MSERTEFDRFLSDWLETDGPQDVPPRVVDSALAEARSMGQTRARWSLADLRLAGRVYLGLQPLPRAFAYAALLLIVLAAFVGAAFVASRPHRLPPPIGPAGNGLLVDDTDGRIAVMSSDGSGRRELTPLSEIATSPAWTPDGTRLAYFSWVIPAGKTADQVRRDWGVTVGSVVAMNADGSDRRVLTSSLTLDGGWPAWSHDGRRVAFSVDRGSTPLIYTVDADGSHLALISVGDTPSWSPDDRTLAFRRPDVGVFVAPSDGSGQPRQVSIVKGFGGAFMDPRWSPDGKWLVYSGGSENGHSIWVVSAAGGPERQIAPSAFDEWSPTWSPDGTRIALTRAVGHSNMSEPEWHFVVVAADGQGEAKEFLAPMIDGLIRAWSPDGRYLIALSAVDPADPAPQAMVVLEVGSGRTDRVPGVSGTPDWQRVAR